VRSSHPSSPIQPVEVFSWAVAAPWRLVTQCHTQVLWLLRVSEFLTRWGLLFQKESLITPL
jgi:hypothetical protein